MVRPPGLPIESNRTKTTPSGPDLCAIGFGGLPSQLLSRGISPTDARDRRTGQPKVSDEAETDGHPPRVLDAVGPHHRASPAPDTRRIARAWPSPRPPPVSRPPASSPAPAGAGPRAGGNRTFLSICSSTAASVCSMRSITGRSSWTSFEEVGERARIEPRAAVGEGDDLVASRHQWWLPVWASQPGG
jgi:hypothetical protein